MGERVRLGVVTTHQAAAAFFDLGHNIIGDFLGLIFQFLQTGKISFWQARFGVDFGFHSMYDLDLLEYRWWEQWLRGVDTGCESKTAHYADVARP